MWLWLVTETDDADELGSVPEVAVADADGRDVSASDAAEDVGELLVSVVGGTSVELCSDEAGGRVALLEGGGASVVVDGEGSAVLAGSEAGAVVEIAVPVPVLEGDTARRSAMSLTLRSAHLPTMGWRLE